MKNLSEFLDRMGGLHDTVVSQVVWRPGVRCLRFEIDDMCSNFRGLPEYPGIVPGFVELSGVEAIRLEVDMTEARLTILEFHVDDQDANKVKVSFWPTGVISASFSTSDYTDVELRPGT